MIIYNVTVNVDADVHEDWLRWMKDEHIPRVLATGSFTGHRMARILADDDGFTYSIQYACADMSTYERYRDVHAPALQAEVKDRYPGRFVAFRTLLDVVDAS